MKKLFIDVETGGLDHKKHALIQLSCIYESSKGTTDSLDLKMKPMPGKTVEDSALNVSGITREDMESFLDPGEGYRQFTDFMGHYIDRYDRTDKAYFIGYNARFDAEFIREFFLNNGDQYYGSWFYWPPIDITNLAALFLMDIRPKMKNMKLITVARTLGIDIDESKTHDAFYDITITKKIYEILINKIKQQ